MNQAQLNQMSAMMREHGTAIRLLTALNEGDDSVMPQVHAFLKQVKARRESERTTASIKEGQREQRKKVGRKNSGAFEVSPRIENGSDHGNTGLILARKGNVRLIWRSGSKFWANMLEGHVYSPGNLVISTLGENGRRIPDNDLTRNHRNAGEADTRLNRKLIEKFSERIDEVFGAGVAEQVAKLKQTVLVQALSD